MIKVKRIRVLIVDDSLFFQKVIEEGLSKDPGIEVVGTASDAYEAKDKILELKPDVLSLDIEMPKMSGIEFLKKIMPKNPMPIVVVSAVSDNVFEALEAGAVDFVTKPEADKQNAVKSFISELIVKIRIASISKSKIGNNKDLISKKETSKSNELNNKDDIVIAIGASTGGTEAILSIVEGFPADMPGIVIVQHMPAVFTRMYAERLNKTCKMEVKEAENGDVLKPGRILVAPGEYQMELLKDNKGFFVKCYKGERVNGHSPSVDVLFNSVAKVAGSQAIGVILTGMGSDGTNGLLEMRKNGAYTIGQDQESSVVYGMPMVAYNIGAVEQQLPLNEIPQAIYEYLKVTQ